MSNKQKLIEKAKVGLMKADIDFQTHNKEYHFQLFNEGVLIVDFWPTSGKWISAINTARGDTGLEGVIKYFQSVVKT